MVYSGWMDCKKEPLWFRCGYTCPACQSANVAHNLWHDFEAIREGADYQCKKCKHRWSVEGALYSVIFI